MDTKRCFAEVSNYKNDIKSGFSSLETTDKNGSRTIIKAYYDNNHWDKKGTSYYCYIHEVNKFPLPFTSYVEIRTETNERKVSFDESGNLHGDILMKQNDVEVKGKYSHGKLMSIEKRNIKKDVTLTPIDGENELKKLWKLKLPAAFPANNEGNFRFDRNPLIGLTLIDLTAVGKDYRGITIEEKKENQLLIYSFVMENKYKVLLLSLMAIFTISCENKGTSTDYEYYYLPIKLVGSERWSILDVQTGKILFKDEFKNQPSLVSHDVFFVENGNGTYDYYNVQNVKKPINKTSYYMASDFVGADIVPATLPCKSITLINSRCEVIATLDKSIKACGKIIDGLAPFMDYSKKVGFIDENGKIVIKAQYDDVQYFHEGIAVCTEKDEEYNLSTYHILNKEGKELFKLTSNDYDYIGTYNDGFLPAMKDNEIVYFDKTGKIVYTLCKIGETGRENLGVFYCKDGRSVFCEGDMFGLKDKENNIVLRAKYDLLTYGGDGIYLAKKENKYGAIDFIDKILLDFKYDGILKLRKNIFLVTNGKTATLVNDKGEDATNVNFSDFTLFQTAFVKSDYDETATPIDDGYMYEDSTAVDTVVTDVENEGNRINGYTLKDFSGKVYSGSGNGGGTGINMTISFMANNECICVSDWYYGLDTEMEKSRGIYYVSGENVVVKCQRPYDGYDMDFKFKIAEEGRILYFDNSDRSSGGSIGNDFMTLEYVKEN